MKDCNEEKCVYCKWYKDNGDWFSKCTNKNCEYNGGQCIEKVWYTNEDCEYKRTDLIKMKNIISWSGGKDSTATVILAHEHNIPIDEIVMACLWFDKARGISAIMPEHWQFITEVAKPKFEEWGYKVTFVDGKTDYLQEFNHVIQNSIYPERNGKKQGFLIAGRCRMTSVKQTAIKTIQRKYEGAISYQGIAIDEPERLKRMHERPNSISLLEQYNYTERQAKELCEKYGLLSPLYAMGGGTLTRDGCWFCVNAGIPERANLKLTHPELWEELRTLSLDPNINPSNSFARGKTFDEVDKEVDRYLKRPKQIDMFYLLDEN